MTRARFVPLNPEKLWLVGVDLAAAPPWLPPEGTCDDLEASGRLQYTSAFDVIVKATSVDADRYKRAKARVLAKTRADAHLRLVHAALKGLDHSVPDTTRRGLAELAEAQRAYVAAAAAVRADDAARLYRRGKAERKARRALGLLDERALRAYGRLRLLWLGYEDAASPLSSLPEDVLKLVAAAADVFPRGRFEPPRTQGSPTPCLPPPAELPMPPTLPLPGLPTPTEVDFVDLMDARLDLV